jgi:hypothetical protein
LHKCNIALQKLSNELFTLQRRVIGYRRTGHPTESYARRMDDSFSGGLTEPASKP